MHDEPLSNLSPKANEQPELDLILDERLIRALETVPDPQIPADFAARVARQLPARRPASLTATHYGKNAMLLGIVSTLAVLLVLALNTTRHASFGLLESILLAEFIALTIWFSVWRYGLR